VEGGMLIGDSSARSLFQYKTTITTQAAIYWRETATFTVNSTSRQEHGKISLIVCQVPKTCRKLKVN